MYGPLRFIRIIAHGHWGLVGKWDILLFLELINFGIKIIPEIVENWYLSHEKYSKSSKNLRKILRDILQHEEPK